VNGLGPAAHPEVSKDERPEKRQPSDWNWADFIGSLLILLAHFRHREKLPSSLHAKILASLRHAAFGLRQCHCRFHWLSKSRPGVARLQAGREVQASRAHPKILAEA